MGILRFSEKENITVTDLNSCEISCSYGYRNRCRLQEGLGARLRGREATQRSKKGFEKALRSALGLTVEKASEKGSQKGF